MLIHEIAIEQTTLDDSDLFEIEDGLTGESKYIKRQTLREQALPAGWVIPYMRNDDPAVNGDRLILLQGQVIEIADYIPLVDNTYCGDADNATAPAFYKTSDAGGTTRDTAGAYFVLPDVRGLSLKNIGNATVNGRTKTGPAALGEKQEDQGQGWQAGAAADSTGARDYWGRLINRDQGSALTGSVNFAAIFYGTAYQGGANMIKAMNDGTNGDIRNGLHFRDSTLGTNYGITY